MSSAGSFPQTPASSISSRYPVHFAAFASAPPSVSKTPAAYARNKSTALVNRAPKPGSFGAASTAIASYAGIATTRKTITTYNNCFAMEQSISR
ncbi:hypothetical protein HK102_009678 [Quaeritorhiza haematococci]|nr:hypothetical protein HK102_009678 [Quaeritorhiza haematococci]